MVWVKNNKAGISLGKKSRLKIVWVKNNKVRNSMGKRKQYKKVEIKIERGKKLWVKK